MPKKGNTLSFCDLGTAPPDMPLASSNAFEQAQWNRREMPTVANLDPEQVLRAVLPEAHPLAKAAHDADPTLVSGSTIMLNRMAPEEMPRTLRYSIHLSMFGQLLIASYSRGVCHVTFTETDHSALQELSATFPGVQLLQGEDPLHLKVLAFVNGAYDHGAKIVLSMRGTAFQHRVWAALLQIPRGTLVTYGQIAQFIGQPQSARAVGTAIGANRAALLIPCHRVVRRSGAIGGFMWGVERKTDLILAETGGLQT